MTHSKLDAWPGATDNGCVKFTLPLLLLSAGLLPLVLTGCGPRAASPKQLTALHEQNALLRDEIARMETLIRQAGDDTPGLVDQIARREQELRAATEELCHLIEQETELKKRALRLQGRLEAFQHSFTQMQKELTNSTRK